MPRRPKTLRKEHLNETRAVVIAFYKYKLLNGKITAETGLAKSSVTSIIRQWRKSNYSSTNKSKRVGPQPKLDPRAERHLVRHVASNPFDNLKVLATPSKLGYIMPVILLDWSQFGLDWTGAGLLTFKGNR
jgi:hypothetical protein